MLDVQPSRHDVADVLDLAAVGADDRLDALGPAPAGLERVPADLAAGRASRARPSSSSGVRVSSGAREVVDLDSRHVLLLLGVERGMRRQRQRPRRRRVAESFASSVAGPASQAPGAVRIHGASIGCRLTRVQRATPGDTAMWRSRSGDRSRTTLRPRVASAFGSVTSPSQRWRQPFPRGEAVPRGGIACARGCSHEEVRGAEGARARVLRGGLDAGPGQPRGRVPRRGPRRPPRDAVPGAPPSRRRRNSIQVVETVGAGIPDLTRTVEQQIAEGDRVVTRFTDRGTHSGPLMGIPATGRAVQVGGINIERVVDGRIAEVWHVEDIVGLLGQLGVLG